LLQRFLAQAVGVVLSWLAPQRIVLAWSGWCNCDMAAALCT